MTPALTAMILEVSAPPQRQVTRGDEDDAAPDVDETSPPVSDEGDEPQRERRSARDEDDEDRGPVDVLEDLTRDRDDEDGDDDAEPAPEPNVPLTPPVSEEAPAAPA